MGFVSLSDPVAPRPRLERLTKLPAPATPSTTSPEVARSPEGSAEFDAVHGGLFR